MPKHGKRYRSLRERVDPTKRYSSAEAAALVKELATAKFDETVEAHLRLGIDPRKSDQNVRGTVALPHGTGRSVRVLALTQGERVAEAEAAGADYVGGDELIARIQEGWLDFDAVVATPDMMAAVGSKLGRILGPRGLLPNPRSGTVGPNIGELVRALKAGQIEFRNDKTGVVHAPIGKASFEPEKLAENLEAFRRAVEAAKPDAARGVFIRTAYLSSTMGPSIPLEL
ncbi:50S ribosomal protein L1 [Truepera radiovictrix]|uniref:Large ribosomal subunit protein uL1 n=1 Tax=Truepera radiovictrix (strain DSM 17093 / CIP 108686 / LMG 22925 / RQ-24) TaxID=649638 RepID=D7CTP0_TRURR|nr:50S ribosomal protein L1 [Truepera radiovictrix]ADI15587.1 ribosomal protein L1 [Truepera radiovictrix DSM 17093]WMT58784.1 50S ribosomal protein L1 [Truepera radiovictrix]